MVYIIIIQARMGSTRLPGKVMKKLLDKEIVLWSYDRCLKTKVDDVFIATSINTDNDVLEKLFIENKIKYYRGSEMDLLDNLPNTIEYLSCSGNNLTSLNKLPSSLQKLYCFNNLITQLDYLPSNLELLNCSNNLLKHLNNLPHTLKDLYCSNNPFIYKFTPTLENIIKYNLKKNKTKI